MPYPNFHSARIKDPDLFLRIVVLKTLDNGIMIYGGPLKSDPQGGTEAQAYRFPKDKFTVAGAKKWLKDHNIEYISFEPATGESSSAIDKESTMYVKINELERRCLPTAELRIDGTEAAPKIIGYAAVFNTWADISGWFKESIRPGAFTKTIKENDIRALMNHNSNYVLGRNKAGTLKLHEDSKGLAIEIDPVPATWAKDLMVSMRRGDVNQMSFQFDVNKQEADYEKKERILIDVTLFDVSVVTFAAYPTTSAQVRSLFQHRELPMACQGCKKWEGLDRIMAKIKSGESLTSDEQREMMPYLPDLSIPARKPNGDLSDPARKPIGSDTSKGKDRISQLLIRAEMVAPSMN